MRKFIVSIVTSDLAFHHVNIMFTEDEKVSMDSVQEKTEKQVKNMCERILAFRIIAWSPVDEFSI
jgi:phosphoribosylformylglycinamidine (FGAM) synthase PurS component